MLLLSLVKFIGGGGGVVVSLDCAAVDGGCILGLPCKHGVV